MNFNYKILATDEAAKAAELQTAHGTIKTPVFMNVATQAAIKGAVSSVDLCAVKCDVVLANTYHLHLRPGDGLVRDMGGLHKFMAWSGPILTDSGGFQVFSLSGLRKITEEGVTFASHLDGRRIFMGPEESMQIQANLGSDIIMAFDECIPSKSERAYVETSVSRTTRWLERCRDELRRLNTLSQINNENQMLFAINQGGLFKDIRINHAKALTDMNLPGYAIGGLAVGETHEDMYSILDATVPHLPRNKPTYLMGVGTPVNIVEAVARGIDFFDCVMPARNGRHGHVFTWHGKLNMLNKQFEKDDKPIDEACACPACLTYSRAYIRHLFKAGEMLALRLCVLHNLYFYNSLMEEIRASITAKTFNVLRLRINQAYR
ncbi:MAG: tRNA guanosine(34) transglycosylase Tgt [Defluviitaleaceae bacterium]|nr:tRNA guanosine(34) transglycosylase Tgt [Defluviitaleaceae bacterium]